MLKRLLFKNRCESKGCRNEATTRLSAIIGEAEDVMALYAERRYCVKCGIMKLMEFGSDMKLEFDIEAEIRKIFEERDE